MQKLKCGDFNDVQVKGLYVSCLDFFLDLSSFFLGGGGGGGGSLMFLFVFVKIFCFKNRPNNFEKINLFEGLTHTYINPLRDFGFKMYSFLMSV